MHDVEYIKAMNARRSTPAARAASHFEQKQAARREALEFVLETLCDGNDSWGKDIAAALESGDYEGAKMKALIAHGAPEINLAEPCPECANLKQFARGMTGD